MLVKHAMIAGIFSLAAGFSVSTHADVWDVLDPLGIGKAARDIVDPPGTPSAPRLVPIRADSPCNGVVVSPDGYGNTNFYFSQDAGLNDRTDQKYHVEFSRDNGTTWENPGATNAQETPGMIQVSLKNLLLISKSWQWRVVEMGRSNFSNACAFSIKPSGITVLPAPIIKAPLCNSNFKSGLVQFNLAPAKGQYSRFKTELQYKRDGHWIDSDLLPEIDQDKPGTKYGAVIPADVLMKDRFNATAWRMRARISVEHLPEVFRTTTEGAYTPWCAFTVGTNSTAATSGSIPKIGLAQPTDGLPISGSGTPGSGLIMDHRTTPNTSKPRIPVGNTPSNVPAPRGTPLPRPANVGEPPIVPQRGVANPSTGSIVTPETQAPGTSNTVDPSMPAVVQPIQSPESAGRPGATPAPVLTPVKPKTPLPRP